MARRKRPSRDEIEIVELVSEIKAVNDAAKFQPDAWEKEQLLAEKSRLQSDLLRHYGERFELHEEARGTIGIMGRDSDLDACHARLDRLDPDVRQWALGQLKRR
jgi:hypothetical protein